MSPCWLLNIKLWNNEVGNMLKKEGRSHTLLSTLGISLMVNHRSVCSSSNPWKKVKNLAENQGYPNPFFPTRLTKATWAYYCSLKVYIVVHYVSSKFFHWAWSSRSLRKLQRWVHCKTQTKYPMHGREDLATISCTYTYERLVSASSSGMGPYNEQFFRLLL
jgi:hypothetical protein